MKVSLASFCSISVLTISTTALAQGTEVEPNHPCALAQSLGEIALPFELRGALDALLEEGDIDFYRFRGAPNAGMQVDLKGLDSGAGTLRDPFLGLFDSNCNFLKRGDDRGSTDEQILATIPANGEFIVAATGCCDHDFDGEVGVGGSYRLSIQRAAFLGSIRGRAVDAVSGVPLDGSEFPYARAELYRCTLADCSEWVNSAGAGADGQVLFESDPWGDPLFAGRYKIRASAFQHADAETIPADIGEGEERDLGDIALVPLTRIGSISGRVLDSVSGIPMPGDTAPFTRVELRQCDGGVCHGIRFESTDHQGRFRFDNDSFDVLAPGTYQVHAEAEEYRGAETTPFAVAEGEDVLLNDLPLEPFPVGFSEIRPCGNVPPEGGLCIFSVRITNPTAGPVNGTAWSIIEGFGTGSLVGRTTFQAGSRLVSLGPGHSRVVWFLFLIPATIRNGSTICSDVFVGQGRPGVAFNTVGHRNLFCIQKGFTGSLRVLTEKERGMLLLQRWRERIEPRAPRR